MKTPEDKYNNDGKYHYVVDMLEARLHNAEFTPSEVREMAMLACIHYEMRQIRPLKIPADLERAFIEIESFRTGSRQRESKRIR